MTSIVHIRHGWFAERDDNGSVRLFITGDHTPGGTIKERITIDAGLWAQVVAAMSKGGSTPSTLALATAVHLGGEAV